MKNRNIAVDPLSKARNTTFDLMKLNQGGPHPIHIKIEDQTGIPNPNQGA